MGRKHSREVCTLGKCVSTSATCAAGHPLSISCAPPLFRPIKRMLPSLGRTQKSAAISREDRPGDQVAAAPAGAYMGNGHKSRRFCQVQHLRLGCAQDAVGKFCALLHGAHPGAPRWQGSKGLARKRVNEMCVHLPGLKTGRSRMPRTSGVSSSARAMRSARSRS